MRAIRTEKLSKSFGDVKAVRDLDLVVERGEVYGLIGPNGSGKTTTVKMLCGLLGPDSGGGTVLGRKLGHRKIASGIGYMPQDTALYPELTVRENLRVFWEVYGGGRERYEAREREVLDLVDLYGRRHFILSKLSGGQRHRISLAVSLIHSPKLLLLDEPTVGVDPSLRVKFWDTFAIQKRTGVSILITTHYMDEARHCDRIGLMRAGRLIAEGTPGNIMKRTGTSDLEEAFLRLASPGEKTFPDREERKEAGR